MKNKQALKRLKKKYPNCRLRDSFNSGDSGPFYTYLEIPNGTFLGFTRWEVVARRCNANGEWAPMTNEATKVIKGI